MKSIHKTGLAAAAAVYLFLLVAMALDVRRAAVLKESRARDFSAFADMYVKIPPFRPSVKSSEPLLIRLQKSVEPLDLKDRAPRWSGKDSSPGQNPSVSLNIEGVPFERLASFLERLSAEPDVALTAFRIERSGASKERFDFDATFTASSLGSALSAP